MLTRSLVLVATLLFPSTVLPVTTDFTVECRAGEVFHAGTYRCGAVSGANEAGAHIEPEYPGAIGNPFFADLHAGGFAMGDAEASAQALLSFYLGSAGPVRPGLIDLDLAVTACIACSQVFSRIGEYRVGYDGTEPPLRGLFPFTLGQPFEVVLGGRFHTPIADFPRSPTFSTRAGFRLYEADGTTLVSVKEIPEPEPVALILAGLPVLAAARLAYGRNR